MLVAALPVCVLRGTVGEVRVEVPWRALRSKPIIVHVERVLLLVTACNSALYYSHRYELQNFGLYELIVASRAADRMDMVNDALRRRDLRAPDVRPRSELSNVVDSVRLYYRWANGRDVDIFTPSNLAAMCEAENIGHLGAALARER